MLDLVMTAYGVEASNVIGGPSWLETDRFNIIAKGPADATPDTLKIMLQALLADRFQLAVHNDTRPMSAYALSAGKKPLLKPSEKPADGTSGSGCQNQQSDSQFINFSYSCRNMTMTELATSLPGMARPYIGGNAVVDLTGLKGAWDFSLKFSRPVVLATAGSEGISLSDAMNKQLGLKLELQKVPIPVVIVDSVNQKPSMNPEGITEKLPPLPTEFEVAEIKPSPPGVQENFRMQPGGRIDVSGITLKDLVKWAWDLDDNDDLLAGPKWMADERFNVVAKAPTADQSDSETLALMMRSLLVSRFKLATHYEDRPVSVYALLAAKPKMKKADPANRSNCKNAGAGGANAALFRNFTCQNATMALLAERLSVIAPGYINHPVIDLTGLNGAWDFTFSFSGVAAFQSGAGSSDPNGAVSLFEAVDKQIGLKLEVQKHPMPVFVIDHIEQMPTDN